MNAEPPFDGYNEHAEVSGLLPWYVNGTLREVDHERVDAHLTVCARCREDFRLEARIHAELSSDAAVEYIPATSLRRLHARVDALHPGDAAQPFARAAPTDRPWVARPGWIAASIAALGLALALIAAGQWRASLTRPAYYTVTTPATPIPNAVIRAVFAPQMSVGELQRTLDEAKLNIVGGPGETGVYSLASLSDQNPAGAVALLRAHSTVRFAELTQPVKPAPESP